MTEIKETHADMIELIIAALNAHERRLSVVVDRLERAEKE